MVQHTFHFRHNGWLADSLLAVGIKILQSVEGTYRRIQRARYGVRSETAIREARPVCLVYLYDRNLHSCHGGA